MAQPATTNPNPTTTKAMSTKPKPGKLSHQHKSPPRKIRKPVFEGEYEDQAESGEVFEDREGRHIFLTRGCLLGEGGFARVYAMKNERTNQMGALKVVSKDQLKSSKNKSKLYAEIKLHRAMDHPHIVRFDSCFEDAQNVYLQMELCEHGSLLDLLRLRKRYSEPEARLLLFQLISACVYMHASSVIHRDLKPGNLFFATESSSLYGQDGKDEPDVERGLCVKVGDFGLAALVKFKGDRRKTICGTPNYIAPEILFDQTNGHSFEVDIWSVGVILYALLIGKPPFQTKDVNQIYRNIKANAYSFPSPSPISSSATHLISLILNQNPNERPSLGAVVMHPWFSDGAFPFMIPMSALDVCPDFSRLSKLQSDRFRNDYIRKLGLDTALQDEAVSLANLSRSQHNLTSTDEDMMTAYDTLNESRKLNGITEEEEDEDVRAVSKKMSKATLKSDNADAVASKVAKGKRALGASASSRGDRPHQHKRVVSSGPVGVTLSDPIKASKERRRVEQEAQSAVNPGSPISELLKSARKPLYVSPRGALPAQMGSFAAPGGGTQLFQQLIEEKENDQNVKGAVQQAERPVTRGATQVDDEEQDALDERDGLGRSTRAERKAKRVAVPHRIKDENDLGRQKARIASGMLDYTSGWPSSQRHRHLDEDLEDLPPGEKQTDESRPSSRASRVPGKPQSKLSSKASSSQLGRSSPHSTVTSTSDNAASSSSKLAKSTTTNNPTIALYAACYQTLSSALGATTPEELIKLPFYNDHHQHHNLETETTVEDGMRGPGVFIQSWVDYTHKYGTAYAMTDGSSGLYFNDGTTMVMAADRNHFDYIFNRTGMIYQRKNYTLNPKNYPIELERKTYLLEYFEDYMFTTLKRNVRWAYRDLKKLKHLDFVVKYYRMNNAIVFKMSNDLIQINFWDHQKLLLTENGKKITLIEPDLNLKTYYIGELFKEAFELGLFKVEKEYKKDHERDEEDDGEEEEEKDRDEEWIQRRDRVAFVLSKLEYARSVLKSLVDRGNKNEEKKKEKV